jgi:general secretion pathway protein G
MKGFTLIELLIVMALLGILVAILLPRYQDLTPEAKIAATQANLQTIRSAIVIYTAKNFTPVFPANMDTLVSLGFLRKVPMETISAKNEVTVDPSGAPSYDGGWVYYTANGDVRVDLDANEMNNLLGADYSSINPYVEW